MITPLTAEQRPLVSVGMPVHNEERFIARSIDSILAQDYPNLEFIISDNASTDRTQAICENAAKRDARIRYNRLTGNRGAADNFQRVRDLATGTYFMWASGHDLWSPNYLRGCVELLEQHPSSAVAFGCPNWGDENGNPMDRYSGWTDTRGMSPAARFFTAFWGNMHPVLGVIRARYLRECRPMHSTVGADLILLSELALKGDFVHAASASWSRREFRRETNYADKITRYTSASYGLSTSFLGKHFPLAQLPLELIRVVLGARVSRADKFCILAALIPSLPVRYVVGKRQSAAG
jgi:glycosyltransferase involved in cell wall biosynthesis